MHCKFGGCCLFAWRVVIGSIGRLICKVVFGRVGEPAGRGFGFASRAFTRSIVLFSASVSSGSRDHPIASCFFGLRAGLFGCCNNRLKENSASLLIIFGRLDSCNRIHGSTFFFHIWTR